MSQAPATTCQEPLTNSACRTICWTPRALATGDLAKYSTIMLASAPMPRARREAYNQRLLDYVAQGGVLIVQYNTPETSRTTARFPTP